MTAQNRSSNRSGGTDQLSLAQVPTVDQDAERAVLGALLLWDDPSRILRLLDHGLTPECFYWESHRAIYEASVSLGKQQIGIDTITLRAEMEKLGTKDEATQAQIDNLAGWVPAAGNLLHYANIVIEMAQWRRRQTVAHEMLNAIEKLDHKAWVQTVAVFVPTEEQEKPDDNVIVLRTVNQDGEVVGEERRCSSCEELRGQVKGLEKDLRTWRTRYANLARDKEAEARADGWWTDTMKLFEMWKKLTGHKRSPFNADRFFECAPYLHNDKDYGVSSVAKAIVGISYDPYSKRRKNGTLKKFDEWGRVFKSPDDFEEFFNKAPSDWREKLTENVKQMIDVRKPQPQTAKSTAKQKQLSAVEASA